MLSVLAILALVGSLVVPSWQLRVAEREGRWPSRRILRRVRTEVGGGAFRDGSVEHDELIEEHGASLPSKWRSTAFAQLWTAQWSALVPLAMLLSLAVLQQDGSRWLNLAGGAIVLAYNEGLRRAFAATKAWLRFDERAASEGFRRSTQLMTAGTMAMLLWLLVAVARLQLGALSLLLLPLFAGLVQVSKTRDAAASSFDELRAFETRDGVRVRYVTEPSRTPNSGDVVADAAMMDSSHAGRSEPNSERESVASEGGRGERTKT